MAARTGGRTTVTFDNFGGGEAGDLFDPDAPTGSFTGQNVLRYIDGSIGPRPGLKQFSLTSAPTGAVAGFGHNPSQVKAWFVIGSTGVVYQFGTGSASATVASVGTMAAAATKRIRTFAEAGTSTYISNYNDKCYNLVHSGPTLTSLASTPGGRVAIFYGDRLLVSSDATNSERLHFSAAADPTSFPAANFIDIGVDYETYLLAVQRTQLVLAKHDGSWWRLSGTPGVDEVLRQVARGLSPYTDGNFGSTRYGMSADGRVWFVVQHGDYPAVFTGAGFQSFEHLRLNPTFTTSATAESGLIASVGVTGLTNPTDVLFVSGSQGSAGSAYDDAALLFTRGIWTKHTFDVALSGWVDGHLSAGRYAYFCDGGGSGVTPKFYIWPYDLNRPPISGNTFESIGDGSTTPPTCEFTLPEWWSKDGARVQVRAVVVDFKKWNHGFTGSSNNITVTVTPLRADPSLVDSTGGGDGTAVTDTWSEAASSASASGTRDHQIFREWSAQPGWGNGFKIKLGALVGVAIQRVRVVLETAEGQV